VLFFGLFFVAPPENFFADALAGEEPFSEHLWFILNIRNENRVNVYFMNEDESYNTTPIIKWLALVYVCYVCGKYGV